VTLPAGQQSATQKIQFCTITTKTLWLRESLSENLRFSQTGERFSSWREILWREILWREILWRAGERDLGAPKKTTEPKNLKNGIFGLFYGWMDGLCFIRTLLQRPFQQEFRGALGTRSTIINYGKKKVCAASRHN
jgi:hypothetical protein